jgi:hypothetical protein
MGQFEKYFTPEEATRMLPLIKKIVSDLLQTGRDIQSLQLKNEPGDKELDALVSRLNDLMDELSELGCDFKDWNFELGLVDFPAIIDNREVFLCWRSDEETLAYYHGLYDGYTGRQPIPPEYLPGA